MASTTPYKYDAAFCEQLVEHMGQGLSFVSFAGKINVAASTINDWISRYPEFGDAKAKGEVKCLEFWEKVGIKGMVGQIKGFMPAVWIFSMKARFVKYGWRDIPVEQDQDAEEISKLETQKLLTLVRSGRQSKR